MIKAVPSCRGIRGSAHAAAAVLALFILSGGDGCSPRPHASGAPELAPKRGDRTALLPLDNLSESPEASRRYTQILFDAISGKGCLDLVPPSDVDRILGKYRVRRTDVVDSTVVRALHSDLGAQFVLIGAIIDLTEAGSSASGSCEITVTLRLVEAATGKVVWTCSDARSGTDGEGPFGWGVETRVSKLATESAQAIAEKLNSFVRSPKSH